MTARDIGIAMFILPASILLLGMVISMIADLVFIYGARKVVTWFARISFVVGWFSTAIWLISR